jgi:hypothetical protein
MDHKEWTLANHLESRIEECDILRCRIPLRPSVPRDLDPSVRRRTVEESAENALHAGGCNP